MQEYLSYKGYRGSIEREEDYYWGQVMGLDKSILLYEGKTLEELDSDFKGCIEDYYEFCSTQGIDIEVPVYSE